MTVDALVEELATALRAEANARAAQHRAREDAGGVLRDLRSTGISWDRIAFRVAGALGKRLDIRERLQLAERLRQLARRTGRPANRLPPHGEVASAAAASTRKELDPMPKLLKKTVTTVEEFIEKAEPGYPMGPLSEVDAENEDEETETDEEECRPRPGKPAARGKR